MPEPRNEKEWEIYRRLKEQYKDNPAMLKEIEQDREAKTNESWETIEYFINF